MPHWAISILAFVALIAGMSIFLQIRTRQIAASRAGETFEMFSASFCREEVSLEVLWAVYESFESRNGKPFPVRADDVISDIYRMSDEDLDNTVLQVLAECNRKCPSVDQIESMSPILTIRDLMHFVAKCDYTGENAQ